MTRRGESQTVFKDGTEWTSEIIDHGIETGHTDFAWADDPRSQTFGIHCRTCIHSFVIKANDLYEDRSTRGRLLYEGVRTMNGKDILLETIKREVEKGKIEGAGRKQAPTAWSRILDDDDDDCGSSQTTIAAHPASSEPKRRCAFCLTRPAATRSRDPQLDRCAVCSGLMTLEEWTKRNPSCP